MTLESKTNQYPGPNAHLLSMQQAAHPSNGLWGSFHDQFIAAIAAQLKERVSDAYQVQVGASLQEGSEAESSKEGMTAVFIHATDPQAAGVRIEYLSPLLDEQRLMYASRRRDALEKGLILYEIELCHESLTLLPRPGYPDDPSAQTYAIGLTKPDVHTQWQGFEVDEPFPNLDVVLGTSKIVPNLDLGHAYNQAFYLSKAGTLIDYALPPDPKRDPAYQDAALNKYTLPDQERIRTRMVHIAALHEQGVDLDSVMPMPLAEPS